MSAMADAAAHPLLKFIAFLAVVVVGGALLAPPLYAAAQWGLSVGILPDALAAFKFPKYVTRAMLVVALVLIWPFVRWLGIKSREELGLRRDPRWFTRFATGLGISAAGLAAVAIFVVAAGRATIRDPLPLVRLLEAAATAITVAILEESIFRGVLFGIARRQAPWPRALIVISAVFAVLHFVRAPHHAPAIDVVRWYSGLSLLPGHLWQFGEPTLLIGGLPTYFLVGATLAYTVAKTSSLAMAVGLHAGWVFALRGFSFLSKRQGEASIWLGTDLISGIVPALLVAATWGVLVMMLRQENT